MKQIPLAWQMSPIRSCSSSGDSVSSTTCAGLSVGTGAPRHSWAGGQTHLECSEELLRQLPGVHRHLHIRVQCGQQLLGHLSTVPAHTALPLEELWGSGTRGLGAPMGAAPGTESPHPIPSARTPTPSWDRGLPAVPTPTAPPHPLLEPPPLRLPALTAINGTEGHFPDPHPPLYPLPGPCPQPRPLMGPLPVLAPVVSTPGPYLCSFPEPLPVAPPHQHPHPHVCHTTGRIHTRNRYQAAQTPWRDPYPRRDASLRPYPFPQPPPDPFTGTPTVPTPAAVPPQGPRPAVPAPRPAPRRSRAGRPSAPPPAPAPPPPALRPRAAPPRAPRPPAASARRRPAPTCGARRALSGRKAAARTPPPAAPHAQLPGVARARHAAAPPRRAAPRPVR